jgi:multiple sugar transport system ATP-binding protein
MNLISGTLNSNKDQVNFECIDSKGVEQIPVETYNFLKKNDQNAREVLFGIRPEHMHLSKNNKNDYQIKLKTILSEYIGHEQIITFDYYGQELVGKFSSSIDIPMEKKFNLFFDLDQISIFDKKTGERL